MKQKITYKKISIIFVAIIILSSSVFAFAVSSQYYADNPLYIKPGDSVDTFFTLQNHAGINDVTVQAQITKGADITVITDSNPDNIYLIPLGGKTKVNFRITIPADAKIGDKFPITMIFSSLSSNDGGPIALGSNIGKGFDVIAGEDIDFREIPTPPEEPKNNTFWVYIIIGVVILIIIIF